MKLSSIWKGDRYLLLGFLLICILYLSILFTSQRYADGDEAVIGIMARHIIQQGARPIFFYGQPFGGGGALEAYLAVIPFLLFGQNAISLKLVALVSFLTMLLLTYRYCRIYLDLESARLAFLLLAVATPLIEWHTKMRAGYVFLLLFVILILRVYTGITRMKRIRPAPFILLGFLSGFAYYNMALILTFLLTLFLASFSWKRIFWRVKSVVYFLGGLIIGISPLIYYNLTHNFANLRYTIYIATGGENPWLYQLRQLVFRFFPGFFVGRNVDGIVPRIPLQAWIEYAATLVILGLALYLYRHSLRSIVSALLPEKLRRRSWPPPKPEGILVFYLYLFLFLHTFSRAMIFSPRYLLPLFPVLSIVSGAVIARLLRSGLRSGRIVARLLLVTLAGLGIFNHLGYLRAPTVTDDVLTTEGLVVNAQTSGRAARNIIEYLQEKGVRHVHCSYFLQWRLIFESRESVIASSGEFALEPSRYPPYDREVYQAEIFALIFHRDSIQLQQFLLSEPAQWMYPRMIDEYVVFLPRSLLEEN